ncbi:hypothetical protein [Corticicoccus populi]|uniref:DUF4352 domain-containing protein n=1 Tax=Corticicoccus populi TaxID=1812821 RepID=A0ABW5WQH3_9STAP
MDSMLNVFLKITRQKLLGIGFITAITLLVAGCGGDEPEDAEVDDTATEEVTENPAEDETEETTDEAAEESEDNASDAAEDETDTDASTDESNDEESEDTSGSGSSGDVTEPGATLTIGDSAVLEHPVNDTEDEYALLGATVTDIEEANPADLDILDMEDELAGLVPYYLHITVTGVDEGSSELAGTVLSNPFNGAVDGQQGPAQNLNIIGNFEACNVESLDSEWNADATQDICVISLVPEGSTVNSVIYSPSDSSYDENPVIWEE